MKLITLLAIFLLCTAGFYKTFAQTGSVRGQIITSDGEAAVGVTITVKNKNKISVTGSDGYFTINKIDTGHQVLIISFAGVAPLEKNITVIANQVSALRIFLPESLKMLDEVLLNSHRNGNERILTAAKTPLLSFDLPQTTGSVNNMVISDQQATRVGDIIRNVSGVSLTQTRLGVNETYTARGYSIGINGGAGSILKNGLISNTAGMPEAATLESVEVMKGSTSLLYGNVSGGLLVNLITKKPKFEKGGELKMQLGSNQQYKPIIDFYGPVSKKLAYRLVSTYENDKSFRDVVKTKRVYINPSLLFKLTNKTSVLLQGDFLHAKLTPDFGIGTLDSGRVLPVTIPVSRFHNVLWAFNNVEQRSGSLTIDHKFNDNWQLNFSGSLQSTDVNSYGAGLPNVVSKTGDWNRTLARAHSKEKDGTAQLTVNGKFSTGKIIHQFVAGTDFTRVKTLTNAFKITSGGTVVTTYDKINILDPSLYMRRNDIPDAAITTITTAPSNRAGIYAQDFISLTKKLKVLAGLRLSYQETIRTTIFTTASQATTRGVAATAFNKAFSPKVAIVYQPVKNSSLFASYSNNFTINTGTDIFGQLLTPSIINQYELGVKNNLWNNKISANVSLYHIINSNLAQQAAFKADGTLNSDATVKELKGQTTSNGLEADLTGTLSKNIYFIAGFGYNNMRFTKTSGAKGSNIEGEKVVNNPSHTANFTGFYTFTKTSLRNLKLGLSGFYTGKRLGGYNNTVGQTQTGSRLITLKSFTTVDVSAGYTIKHFSLLCKLSNLFNTVNYLVHDNYSVAPVTPTQMTATISYKF